MGAFFDKFDPKVRLGMWATLSLVPLVAGWLILSKFTAGPLSALLVAGLLAAIGTSLQAEAWPSKLPEWASETIEKWKKMRARSTKSMGGKFAWKLGRSAIAGICLWFALEQFSEVSGFLARAMIFGFAISAGFFGIGPSVWSGMAVFLVGHRLALMGLNVDFASPDSRAALDRAWVSGGAMSWWWPIGLAAAAPIWIFLSFLTQVLSKKLLDEYAEIQAAKEAKRKIEARRARLKQREEEEETDELIEARLARESAERRVASMARGKDGALAAADGAGEADGEPPAEKTATEKLMEEKNVGQLERYIEHAQAIRQNESDGLDVDTKGRRGFDRAVAALDDDQLARLRQGDLAGWEVLEGYYNEICGLEQSVMSGGDGDVVSTQKESDPDEVRSGWSDDSAIPDLVDEFNAGENDPEEEDNQASEVAAPIHRRSAMLDEIEDQLAEPKKMDVPYREGPDGTPVGDSPLPSVAQTEEEDAAEEEAYGSTERLDGPEVVSDGGDFDHFNAVEAENSGVDEDGSELGAAVGAFDEAPPPPEDQSHETVGVDADPESEDVGPEADGREEGADDGSTMEEHSAPIGDAQQSGQTLASEGLEEGSSNAEGAENQDGLAGQEAPEGEPTADQAEAPAWEIAPSHAAAKIMMRKTDRELVLKTVGMFESAEAMASSVGVPAEDIEEVFSEYQALVEGSLKEKQLETELEAGNLEAVGEIVTALEASAWDADAGLLTRAAEFISSKEEEARLAEEARKQEEERQRLEEEAERKREEEERRAESERQRLEQEAAAREEEDRQKAEAEKQRQAVLDEERRKWGIHLLSGQYGDDLLSAGGELFPDVETLADTLGVEVYVVEKQFKVFEEKRIAKEKFDALYAGWKARDLPLVLTLLDDTSDMEAYDDPDDTIGHIKSWAESERKRQEVAGFTEKVHMTGCSANAENQKKFIVKRCKTTDEQIAIIEKSLPETIDIAENLAKVQAAMGASAPPVMREEEDKARLQAGRLAAALVKDERQCKEYVMAFLPGEARGPEAWDRVLELAAKSDGRPPVTGVSAQEAVAAVEESPPKFAQIDQAIDQGPKIRTYEELLSVNPLEELKGREFPQVEEIDFFYRLYRRKWSCIVSDTDRDYAEVEGKYFDVRAHGKTVRMHTALSKIPLWYETRSEGGDRVHVLVPDKENPGLGVIPSSSFERQFSAHFGEESGVDGVIMVSPLLCQEGIRTFEKFLERISSTPSIILNSSLKEEDISAFLDRLKNA